MAGPGQRAEFLSDDELDALRPMEEAVEGLLDQSIGLSKFVEDLEESALSFEQDGGALPRVPATPEREEPEVGAVDAEETDPSPADDAPLGPGQPDDAELRAIARFAPRIDASLLRNFVELGVLFGLIAGTEFSIYDGVVGSYGVHPHPYWIIILPIAASRGVLPGLLAVAFASILFVVGAMEALGTDQLAEVLNYDVMQEPLRFAFVAFFIGQFRDEFASRYRALWRRYMHLHEAAELILRHNSVLASTNEDYKLRLLDHSVQFGNLIDTQKQLDSASDRDVFELALQMVEEHCAASVCSILLVHGPGEFEVAAQIGWNPEFLRERLAESADSLIVRHAAADGSRINGIGEGQLMLGLGPLMAAPLFDGSKAVCALLCLDHLPPDRFAETTASIFFSIADWTQAALDRAERTVSTGDEPEFLRVQRQPWLGSARDLGIQISIEDDRCSRLGLPTSVIALQAESLLGSGADQIASLDEHILASLGANLRDTDTVHRFGYPGCYCIVLAGTPLPGAQILTERIQKWLRYTSGDELGAFHVQVFTPDEEAPDLRSMLQRIAAHFRKRSPVPLSGSCPVTTPKHLPMGSLREFSRRVRLEMGLAMRNRYELYLIYLHVDESENLQLSAFPGHVERYCQESLRGTDGVYQLREDRYVAVLPGGSSAFTCAAAMVTALQPYLPEKDQAKLRCQVFAAHGGGKQMNELLRVLGGLASDPGQNEEWIHG